MPDKIIESSRQAKERQSILESVFQNSEGAICLIDKDLRYVIFNRPYIEEHRILTGKEPLAGQMAYGEFSEEIISDRHARLRSVLNGQKEVIETEHLIDGKHIYYRISFNPVLVDGEITGVISYSLNLTASRENELLRQRTAAALVESEEKFRTLVEQSQVGVYILQDNKFVYISPYIGQIGGYAAGELMAMERFEEIIHPEDREFVRSKYDSRVRGEVERDEFVVRALRKDGSIAFIQVIVSRIIYRNAPAALGSVIDITDKLQESNRINKAVIDAQEKERTQIGMELHDNVQQIIAGTLLNIDYVFASYDKKTQALAALRDIRRYLNDSIAELRRISHQLAPSIRWEHNLEEKIRALVETMKPSAEVQLAIDPMAQSLPDHHQLAIYRILQEQLTNVHKYANASRVSIRLEKVGKRLTLSIKDNGQGFDPVTKNPGIGLENIRRRAAALEGDLKIISSVGNGCELLLQIPMV